MWPITNMSSVRKTNGNYSKLDGFIVMNITQRGGRVNLSDYFYNFQGVGSSTYWLDVCGACNSTWSVHEKYCTVMWARFQRYLKQSPLLRQSLKGRILSMDVTYASRSLAKLNCPPLCRSIICTQTINQANNSSLLVRQPPQPCSASVEATAICFAGRSHSDFQQTAQIENLLNLIIVSSLLSANMKDSGADVSNLLIINCQVVCLHDG